MERYVKLNVEQNAKFCPQLLPIFDWLIKNRWKLERNGMETGLMKMKKV